MASREISNTDDIIDSRDIIERIEELESEREQAMDDIDMDSVGSVDLIELDDIREAKGKEWDETPEGEELAKLKALADEAEGCGDWQYGETLIRDSYFQTYAEELADDIGAIPAGLSWPLTCIDWERAARELQHDYTSVDFDGTTYWIRS